MSGRGAEFLLVHGWMGSEPHDWQRWLERELTRRGRRVSFPQLPDDERPDLSEWLVALDAELRTGAGELCVLCHSLGCWLWLHHAAGRTGEAVARVLLVAPPDPRWTIPELARFPAPPLDAEAVRLAAHSTRLVFSRDDPYCPGGADRAFASLGLETDQIPAGRHLSTDAGYGEWPAALDWCLDGSTRLTARATGGERQ
jgi:predicted alpha/beta hydrolase family esterase